MRSEPEDEDQDVKKNTMKKSINDVKLMVMMMMKKTKKPPMRLSS